MLAPVLDRSSVCLLASVAVWFVGLGFVVLVCWSWLCRFENVTVLLRILRALLAVSLSLSV